MILIEHAAIAFAAMPAADAMMPPILRHYYFRLPMPPAISLCRLAAALPLFFAAADAAPFAS
jgi:hypothetical protein